MGLFSQMLPKRDEISCSSKSVSYLFDSVDKQSKQREQSEQLYTGKNVQGTLRNC